MENSACYAVDPEVTFQKLGEETVLVNLTTGKIHHTNDTGSRVWELLKEGRSVGEILELLEKEFEASREALQSDVTAFVELLTQESMIRLLESDE
ncbi:MAG: PqqD family protein [Acidobacteriota bacterium]